MPELKGALMFETTSISLSEATKARDAIVNAMTSADSPGALAITDSNGIEVLCMRQNGAPARMLGRARAKAYTAARLGIDTVVFRDDFVKASSRSLGDWGDPKLTTLQGGLVIKSNTNHVIGGIAMSGNSTTRDQALASIGLQALEV